METFRGWKLLKTMPEGWRIDKNSGSPLHGYEFVTNGKSVIDAGHERALLLVVPRQRQLFYTGTVNQQEKTEIRKERKVQPVIDSGYVRTVNELARKKFEQRLLNDIMVDLMICEIEGWGKLEYIKELRRLIVGLGAKMCIEA